MTGLTRPLFGNANHERILWIIENDWQRFSMCASAMKLGWLDQFAACCREWRRLRHEFEWEGLDLERLAPVMDLLMAAAYGGTNVVRRLEILSDVTGAEMPGLRRERERAKAIRAADAAFVATRKQRLAPGRIVDRLP